MTSSAPVTFPSTTDAHRQEAPPGIPAQIRRAREAKGFTWYAVAKLAGISNPNTVRDIEYGRDAKLSNVQSVAKVLGLRLELVQETGVTSSMGFPCTPTHIFPRTAETN
jgi:transcriptional regulator with XRE-family HTH domain